MTSDRSNATLLVGGAALVLLAVTACSAGPEAAADPGPSPTTPTTTTTTTPPPPTTEPSEELHLATGEVVPVPGTDIKIELIEAGPVPDELCNEECGFIAFVDVRSSSAERTLLFEINGIDGGTTRRHRVFGLDFVLGTIGDGEMSLTVQVPSDTDLPTGESVILTVDQVGHVPGTDIELELVGPLWRPAECEECAAGPWIIARTGGEEHDLSFDDYRPFGTAITQRGAFGYRFTMEWFSGDEVGLLIEPLEPVTFRLLEELQMISSQIGHLADGDLEIELIRASDAEELFGGCNDCAEIVTIAVRVGGEETILQFTAGGIRGERNLPLEAFGYVFTAIDIGNDEAVLRVLPAEPLSFELGEDFDLLTGQMARLAGGDLEVQLLSATDGSRCERCPEVASIRLWSEGREVDLFFVPNVGNNPRDAEGFVVFIERFGEDEATVTVTIDSKV